MQSQPETETGMNLGSAFRKPGGQRRKRWPFQFSIEFFFHPGHPAGQMTAWLSKQFAGHAC